MFVRRANGQTLVDSTAYGTGVGNTVRAGHLRGVSSSTIGIADAGPRAYGQRHSEPGAHRNGGRVTDRGSLARADSNGRASLAVT